MPTEATQPTLHRAESDSPQRREFLKQAGVLSLGAAGASYIKLNSYQNSIGV